MITRAQAEALLTLAESLEACERLGVTVEQTKSNLTVYYGDRYFTSGNSSGVAPKLSSLNIRLAINLLAPANATNTIGKWF